MSVTEFQRRMIEAQKAIAEKAAIMGATMTPEELSKLPPGAQEQLAQRLERIAEQVRLFVNDLLHNLG